MNKNAISRKSSIRIKKTHTGQCRAGFFPPKGITVEPSEYYKQLVKNGYKVNHTKDGVIVSKD